MKRTHLIPGKRPKRAIILLKRYMATKRYVIVDKKAGAKFLRLMQMVKSTSSWPDPKRRMKITSFGQTIPLHTRAVTGTKEPLMRMTESEQLPGERRVLNDTLGSSSDMKTVDSGIGSTS